MIFEIISSLSECGELMLGHILFLNKIAAYAFSKELVEFASKYNDYFWFFETVFALIAELLNYLNIIKEIRLINEELNSNEENSFETKNGKISKDELKLKKEALKIRLQKMKTNQVRLWGDMIVRKLKFLIF
jgi:hypothetical protein